MKLFQHSNGTIFAFGFDMVKRKADAGMISISDLDGESWEPKVDNQANQLHLDFLVAPEFVREINGEHHPRLSGRSLHRNRLCRGPLRLVVPSSD